MQDNNVCKKGPKKRQTLVILELQLSRLYLCPDTCDCICVLVRVTVSVTSTMLREDKEALTSLKQGDGFRSWFIMAHCTVAVHMLAL